MKRIIFFGLILFLLISCNSKLNNRVRIISLNSIVLNADSQRKEGECFLYDLDSSRNSNLLGIRFDITFESDESKNKKPFTYQPEGADGPSDKIISFDVNLIDSLGLKLNISKYLYNDSSYYLHKVVNSVLNYDNKYIKTQCQSEGEYNCFCQVSNIFESIDDFVTKYNNRDRFVSNEELTYPIYWFIDKLEGIDLLKYKKIEIEITFDNQKKINNIILIN
jgi:hypothetical protein